MVMVESAEVERQRRQLGRLETLMDVMFGLMLFRLDAISGDFDSPAARVMRSLALAGVRFCGFLGFRYAARNRHLLSDSLTDAEAAMQSRTDRSVRRVRIARSCRPEESAHGVLFRQEG